MILVSVREKNPTGYFLTQKTYMYVGNEVYPRQCQNRWFSWSEAFFLLCSSTCAYWFIVKLAVACPANSDTVLGFSLTSSIYVIAVCRRSCKRISGKPIAAARLNAWLILSRRNGLLCRFITNSMRPGPVRSKTKVGLIRFLGCWHMPGK